MPRLAAGLVVLILVFAGPTAAQEARGFFTPDELKQIDLALDLLNMTREDTRFDKLTKIEEMRRFRLPSVDRTLEDPLWAPGFTMAWAERAKGEPRDAVKAAFRELAPLLEPNGPALTEAEIARLRAWARTLLVSGEEEGEGPDPLEMLDLAARYRLADILETFRNLDPAAGGNDVVFGTEGDDVHDLRKNPPRILIDPGGNDRYIAPALGTPEHPVCIVIDRGGNDVYGDGEDMSCGVGFFGVGILMDEGGGNDVYRSGHMSQGCGVFGVGLLIDDGGDDVYECRDTGQGAGAWGVGMLFDRGDGNDRFHADLFGQGFAYVGGFGLLHNERGNDVYDAGGVHKHYPLFNDRFQSLSQGFSIGMRPHASGGIGLLIDDEGNDRYLCDIYGQGASYWFAFGGLVDGDGNDTYNLGQYGQGGGIHLATGVLIDLAGQDLYYNMHGVGTGGAHDFAVGCLVDRKGDDYYAGSGGTQGGALTNSFALLLDGGGNDGYCPQRLTYTLGGGRSARGMGSIGLFVDTGGKDLYGTREPNGTSWTKETYGAGIDIADPPPKPGQRPPPRAKLEPEEAEKRVRERAWDEEKKAWDVAKLWEIARSWAVGEMRFVVPVALEKLSTLGDPAMEKALSVVGTKDGLEYLAVQKVLKHYAEKAIPRLVALLAHEESRWRGRTAGLLADLGAKDSVTAILPLLEDEETVRAALDAIARLDAKDQWGAVTALLKRGAPERTLVAALRCLEKLAVPESAPLAALGITLAPFTVRFAAEDVAVSFGDLLVADLAGVARKSGPDFSLAARRHAISALGRIGAPESLPLLVDLADDENAMIRYEVAGALARYLGTDEGTIAREVMADRLRRETNPHVRDRLRTRSYE